MKTFQKSTVSTLITARTVVEHAVFVARKNGRRIGGATLWLTTAAEVLVACDHMRDPNVITETGRIALLRTIEVHSAHRRCGLGTKFVERAHQAAEDFGAEAIYVHSVDLAGNDPSAFYRACGFTVERRNGDSNYYMKKILRGKNRAAEEM